MTTYSRREIVHRGAVLALGLVAPWPIVRPAREERVATTVYLMAGWPRDGSEVLRLYTSPDGVAFSPIPTSYVPSTGTVRDPSITRVGAVWWLAHTTVPFANTTVFSLARSDDNARTFVPVATVDLSAIAGVNRVWAPEWFVDGDGSVHVFVACSTTGDAPGNFQLYETHPTNAEMTTWSSPVLVTGTGLPAIMIDAFVVKLGSTYHLWYKANNTTELLSYASSSSLTGGYTVTQTGNWAGWGADLEAPSLVPLGGSSWRLYVDKYTGGGTGLYSSESDDDWATWTPKALTSPSNIHHVTVVTTDSDAVISPLTPVQVRDAVDAALTAIWPTLVAHHDTYAAAHGGRYWQGYRTHAVTPADGVATVPTVGTSAPSDKAAYPWPLAIRAASLPMSLVVDCYEAPAGPGYQTTVEVVIAGQTWRRAVQVGPETWRQFGWTQGG